jgi:hypothetical protein
VSGWGQLTVWLFGILMAAVTVQSVAKAKADAKVAVTKAQAEVWLEAQQALRGPLFPPADWAKGAEQ